MSVVAVRSEDAMATKRDIKMASTLVAHETADINKGNLLEIDATKDITTAEHELGFWEAVKQYPYAVFWALFFCIAVIMAGFDAQIITSFYALPSFQSHYGTLYEGEYIITAPWQTGTLRSWYHGF
jgi:SP family general alpha glucoside:H+ symporter-like MFS transporter